MKTTQLAVAAVALGCLGAASGCQTEFVTPLVASSVLVEPQEVGILEGEDLRFTATVIDEFDQPVLDAVVTWSSDDSSIVRVDSDGRAWGLAAGATVVRASFNGTAGSALLTVEPVFTCGSDDIAGNKPGKKKGDPGKKKSQDDDADDDDDDDDDDDPRCSPMADAGT